MLHWFIPMCAMVGTGSIWTYIWFWYSLTDLTVPSGGTQPSNNFHIVLCIFAAWLQTSRNWKLQFESHFSSLISYISYVVGCGILINDHQHSYLHYQPGLISDMLGLCDINRQTYPRETKACCHGPLGWCDRFYQGQEQSVADRSWAWGWRGMAGWVKMMELQYIYIISPPLEGYFSGGDHTKM
jgi:hypothetical protein